MPAKDVAAAITRGIAEKAGARFGNIPVPILIMSVIVGLIIVTTTSGLVQDQVTSIQQNPDGNVTGPVRFMAPVLLFSFVLSPVVILMLWAAGRNRGS